MVLHAHARARTHTHAHTHTHTHTHIHAVLYTGAVVVWPVDIRETRVTNVTRVSVDQNFTLEACPVQSNAPSISHVAVAPVLPSGMAILGDTSKWATMST